MRIIKTYIADDGKKFNNECDCELYEHSLKAKNCSLKFYDHEMILLSQEDLEFCLTKSYYISAPDLDSLELLKELGDYYGCNVPYYRGNWVYDSSISDWICIDEEYINKFKKIIALFGGE